MLKNILTLARFEPASLGSLDDYIRGNYVRVPREGGLLEKSLHTLTFGGGGSNPFLRNIFRRYFMLENTRSSGLAGIIFHLSNNIMVICS